VGGDGQWMGNADKGICHSRMERLSMQYGCGAHELCDPIHQGWPGAGHAKAFSDREHARRTDAG
jgi:hypothetical protein